MNRIYEVWSIALSDGKRHSWGARRSRDEAEQLILQRTTGTNEAWAKKYHARWWIEETDTSGMFQIPPRPTPRERFTADATEIESRTGTWNTLHVDVKGEDNVVAACYIRNYPSLMGTFEPFRQGDRLFALVSADYTCTSVLDLQTGKVIASEEPSAAGFCPVGFYVPDWWDINDGTVLPGSKHWSADDELPQGDFGFVWGCVWGDDSSWKVQYLDLTSVQTGEIRRDNRFGYLRLASHQTLEAREFIVCEFFDGKASVKFDVEQVFDLNTGKPIEEV